MKFSFIHRFGPTAVNGNAFTVAYTRSADGLSLLAAVSRCNPKDNFSRAKGRLLATARLENLVADPTIAEKRPDMFAVIPATANRETDFEAVLDSATKALTSVH